MESRSSKRTTKQINNFHISISQCSIYHYLKMQHRIINIQSIFPALPFTKKSRSNNYYKLSYLLFSICLFQRFLFYILFINIYRPLQHLSHPVQHTLPNSLVGPINSPTFINKQVSLRMRKSITTSFIHHSLKISLENDLPFSMVSEADREVLLLPLYGGLEIDEINLFRIQFIAQQNNVVCVPDETRREVDQSCVEKVERRAVVERVGKDGGKDDNVQKLEQSDRLVVQNEIGSIQPINKDIIKRQMVVKVEDKAENVTDNDKDDAQIDNNSESRESTYNPKNFRQYAPVGYGKKRGPYKKFSQLEKQYLIDQANKFGVSHVVKSEKIARKTLCRWISDGAVRRYGGGRQVGDSVMEEKLMRIIRKHFVEHNEVLEKQKIQKWALELSSKSLFTASHGWFQKFYLRHKRQFEEMLKKQERKKGVKVEG